MLTSCCSHARLYLVWLRGLRMQQPASFSLLCLLVCSGLFVLGRSVSGLLLVYSLLMLVMLGPGLFKHCIPAQLKTTLAQHIVCAQQSFTKYSAEASDDEYMPVTTSEDLALLTRVSNTYDS